MIPEGHKKNDQCAGKFSAPDPLRDARWQQTPAEILVHYQIVLVSPGFLTSI